MGASIQTTLLPETGGNQKKTKKFGGERQKIFLFQSLIDTRGGGMRERVCCCDGNEHGDDRSLVHLKTQQNQTE